MIEVNLLPGAKRGKKAAGKSIDFKAIGAAISERVKDKWLAAAVGFAILSGLVIGGMYLYQGRKEAALQAQQAEAVADSTRFADVLLDRVRAQARRDSILIQLNIIKAIDNDRFIWPHLLDEISRAVPAYTWLASINNLVQQGTNPPAAVRMPRPDTSARGRRRPATQLPTFARDSVRVRITGRTVDLSAMTRFYRNLEDSPFLGGVTLRSSEVVGDGESQVHQFVMDVSYSYPDSTLLRREPLTLPR